MSRDRAPIAAHVMSDLLAGAEQSRLQELRELGLLDTPAEHRFDVITQLAARSLEAPIGLVSLVDEHRQWFKSQFGFSCDSTPRYAFFCTYAIEAPEIFVVPDATQDPRFAHSPWVTGKTQFRFYAGAVLRGPRGYPIGTLCIIDRKPRELTADDRSRLLHLARLVEWELRQGQRIARMLLEVEKDRLHYTAPGIPDRRTIFEALAAMMARGQPVDVALGKVEDLSQWVRSDAQVAALQWEIVRRLQTLESPIQVGMWRQNQFLAFRPTPPETESGTTLASALSGALERDYELDGERPRIRTAIGMASFPGDADSVRSLLQCAQAASCAEASGVPFHLGIYQRDIAPSERRARDVIQALGRAVQEGSLRVEYQPIFSSPTGDLHSAEALLRWDDAQLGSVSPAEFIPLAERSGLIHAIGSFVLQAVVSQLREWADGPHLPVPIAVNISSQQMLAPGFSDIVISLVRGAGLDPGLLTLELTEHALVTDFQAAASVLSTLRDAGIHSTVDDFGVGFSSFNYLRRLPVSTLKIDREFVADAEEGTRSADVIGAVIGLASALGLATIVEGVESEHQLRLVQRLNCTCVQGFHTGAAQRASAFRERLRTRAPLH